MSGADFLVAVHDHLRAELAQLEDVVRQVCEGDLPPHAARSHVSELVLRRNYWATGAFCAAYCQLVGTHHAIEDARMFPDLRAAEPSLGPALDGLAADHVRIGAHLVALDAALVALVRDDDRNGVRRVVDALGTDLRSHLAEEERLLLEPIRRHALAV